MPAPSFCRTETIAPRPAPEARSGLAGRLAEIRRRGPLQAAVSLLSIGVLVWIVWTVLSWSLSDTWSANSLSQCREILADHRHKACWGVIRERWLQILIGFYPRDLMWRPILAFGLLVPGLAWLLRVKAPPGGRKWGFVPFAVAPYLLWGGPVAPVLSAVLAGLAAWLAYRCGARAWLALCVAVATFAAAHALPVSGDVGLAPVTGREFGGFLLSVVIGLCAIVFSLPLGIALALGRTSRLPLLRLVSTGFIEFIRGVPLITLLFVASTLLNIFLPPGTNFDIVLRVIIMVTLFAAAYVAEVVRGALSAVPRGQTEGAASLGLAYWQTQRLIVLPQALRISIPGIVSTFISVFKDTTLVSVIGLLDPLGLANNIRADSAWTGIAWEIYGFVAVLFFALCFAMSQYSMWLERQLRTDHR
ncbi:amino acid ABC transporter permease [Kaustia mangrovi]|uniref:Amino acid ABC transporter permease n=1 Tax=Kaustia mangrovi TaxID=2593653 RepID=A0A7S8C5W2_9HYPH|nr:amino acid ABC transporter permease [Kaustia mangrovi]QPC43896.1 amino acid ABC transporter permease [Kaustia mangrovi]